MTTVAVLADIHGALPALEAVLAEPDVQAADVVVLAGDIASGPQPVETLDLLVSLGERAVWVRGNADRELVEMARGVYDREPPDPVSPWAAGELRPDQVALLADLPTTVTLGDALYCHATPGRGQDRRLRSHAHALREAGGPATGGERGQRGDAVRRARSQLGAADR
jgi:predicted phosphodiesterase